MFTLPCPSCGAQVPFLSKVSVFAVCPYCNCTILRNDVDPRRLGEMAVLQDDYSVLQRGTSGSYEGNEFQLVGRVQYQWERGNWMEWFVVFPDNSYPEGGWLAEAQGFYAVSFLERGIENLPKREEIQAGQSIELKGAQFVITDIKQTSVIYSEGELPFIAEVGSTRVSADLSGEGNWFGSLEYYDGDDSCSLYLGQYRTFTELNFQNVKALDGW